MSDIGIIADILDDAPTRDIVAKLDRVGRHRGAGLDRPAASKGGGRLVDHRLDLYAARAAVNSGARG